MRWLTRQDFEAARRQVTPVLHRTPLLSCHTLGEATGTRAFLKCENLQKTGSFKVRGALQAVASLSVDERARGVITISAGNHAQAVAWVAGRAGVRAVVIMPETASPTKVEAAKGYGAEVVLHGDAGQAFREAHRRAEVDGLTFLHPFDSEEVIAGHGSVGLELDEEIEGSATIVVPVGGGGQIAGIVGSLAALGRTSPGNGGHGHSVYGVEPRGAPAMHLSLRRRQPASLERTDTIADGLAAPMAGELTYRYTREFVRDVVLVSDEEILAAIRFLATRAKLVTEPSGAAAVAAVIFGRIPLAKGSTVVMMISGGNVEPELLARAMTEGAPWP